jgi:hypothetical protein
VSELTLPVQTARGKFKNLVPFLTVDKPVDLHVKLQLETPEDRGTCLIPPVWVMSSVANV